MGDMTIAEATSLIRSHEIECDEATVEEWIINGDLKASKYSKDYSIVGSDVMEFLIDLSRVGTAYEKGIDDKTKIKRLEEEIKDLNSEVEKLKRKKQNLELQLGIMPF
ncbi:hypothetical protein ACW2QC_20075 [Virgibacillus sp. FSP13]